MTPSRSSRGRSRQALSVPDLAVDAAERKRVLNVLAQRRYRERKRVAHRSTPTDERGVISPESLGNSSTGKENYMSESPSGQGDLELTAIDGQIRLDMDFDFDSWNPQASDSSLTWPLIGGDELSPLLALEGLSDSSFTLSSTSPTLDLAPLLQEYQTAITSFPDTHLLPIPALTLLRACLTIAARLGVAMQLWDCESISPFYLSASNFSAGSNTPSYINSFIDTSSLPQNLQPTRTQQLVPHHPLFDVLPWPSVRDKLILFFAQPVELRPAMLDMGQFVADLEDEAEGVVINNEGRDPWDASRWEVGGAIRKRWWFVLDSEVKRR